MSRLLENYRSVSEEVRRAAGSRPVQLLVVSKTIPEVILQELYDAGVREFAENREPELARKTAAMPSGIIWHFIGPLQSNKVRKVVKMASVIHSVSSVELLERIDRIAGEEKRHPELYLEVNVSGEATKGGAAPAELPALAAAAKRCENVSVRGLMTMAPLAAGEAELKAVFSGLAALAAQHGFAGLSMGMSRDFPTAIACGSTLVRVGSRIFEGVPR